MNDSSQIKPSDKKKSGYLDLGFLKIPRILFSIGEKVLLLIILALAVYYLLPQLSSIEKSVKILKSLKLWAILMALICQFCSYMGNGLTISECVKLTKNRVSTFRSMLITLASYSIGLVAGGMFGSAATTFRWVKASGGGNEGASLAASLPPIFVDIALIGVSIFGLIFLLITNDLSRAQAIAFLLIVLLLIAISLFFVLAVRHKEKAIQTTIKFLSGFYRTFKIKKELPVEKITASLEQVISTWQFLIQDGWKGPLLGSFINILFDMGTVYFMFIASGNLISPIVLISGYGLPLLFGRMAFIFPGGVGIVESSMIALYTSLGIDNSLTTVVVLTYRVISFWMPSISGFFLLPFFNRITGNRIPGSST